MKKGIDNWLSLVVLAVIIIAVVVIIFTFRPFSKSVQDVSPLPDSSRTPGSVDPAVSQDDIGSTICVSGYTATVRPSTDYTNKLKSQQIREYNYADTNMSDYEEDHLIPLELGGNPTDPKNLWPEPYYGHYSAWVKDRLENYLHDQVCSRQMNLSYAQSLIAVDWVSAYTKYLGGA